MAGSPGPSVPRLNGVVRDSSLSRSGAMEKASEVTCPLNFFDDFVDQVLEIECCSWEYEYASKIWGPNLAGKTTKGIIKKVSYNRRTKKPKFEVFVPDTKETYTNLDLDYVLTYSNEVPLKYHEIKGEFIVRLSRNAGHLWMPKGQTEEDTKLPGTPVHQDETEQALEKSINLPKKKKSRLDDSLKGKAKASKQMLFLSPAKERKFEIKLGKVFLKS
jgi:hypothetical protein